MDLDFDFPVCALRSTTAAQEQKSVQYTDVVHDSALGFRTPQDLFTQVRKDILYTKQSKELVYVNVPTDWGPLVTDSLNEHEEVESSNAKINFNSYTSILWIRIMPSRIHECYVNWFQGEMDDWRDNNIMQRMEKKLLKIYINLTNARFSAAYQNSRKIPDFSIIPDNQYHPSLVIESGWSESWAHLTQDMRLWLIGGRPSVNVVILMKWARIGTSNQVKGFAEVYVRDASGNPTMRQNVTIFPATNPAPSLTITWGELFGPLLPQGRNSATNLNLDINNLRVEAREALVHMNMVPAV